MDLFGKRNGSQQKRARRARRMPVMKAVPVMKVHTLDPEEGPGRTRPGQYDPDLHASDDIRRPIPSEPDPYASQTRFSDTSASDPGPMRPSAPAWDGVRFAAANHHQRPLTDRPESDPEGEGRPRPGAPAREEPIHRAEAAPMPEALPKAMADPDAARGPEPAPRPLPEPDLRPDLEPAARAETPSDTLDDVGARSLFRTIRGDEAQTSSPRETTLATGGSPATRPRKLFSDRPEPGGAEEPRSVIQPVPPVLDRPVPDDLENGREDTSTSASSIFANLASKPLADPLHPAVEPRAEILDPDAEAPSRPLFDTLDRSPSRYLGDTDAERDLASPLQDEALRAHFEPPAPSAIRDFGPADASSGSVSENTDQRADRLDRFEPVDAAAVRHFAPPASPAPGEPPRNEMPERAERSTDLGRAAATPIIRDFDRSRPDPEERPAVEDPPADRPAAPERSLLRGIASDRAEDRKRADVAPKEETTIVSPVIRDFDRSRPDPEERPADEDPPAEWPVASERSLLRGIASDRAEDTERADVTPKEEATIVAPVIRDFKSSRPLADERPDGEEAPAASTEPVRAASSRYFQNTPKVPDQVSGPEDDPQETTDNAPLRDGGRETARLRDNFRSPHEPLEQPAGTGASTGERSSVRPAAMDETERSRQMFRSARGDSIGERIVASQARKAQAAPSHPPSAEQEAPKSAATPEPAPSRSFDDAVKSWEASRMRRADPAPDEIPSWEPERPVTAGAYHPDDRSASLEDHRREVEGNHDVHPRRDERRPPARRPKQAPARRAQGKARPKKRGRRRPDLLTRATQLFKTPALKGRRSGGGGGRPTPRGKPGSASQEAEIAAKVPIQRGLLVVLLTFGLFGGWAAFTKLDSAVIAPGSLTVSSKSKQVQHLEGGIIRKILVRDGDFVRQGTPLLRLDSTHETAEHSITRRRYDESRATVARLVAQRDGLEAILFPQDLVDRQSVPQVAEILKQQIEAFRSERQLHEGQIALHRQRIDQLNAEIAGVEAEARANRRQISLLSEELSGMNELLAKGFASRNRVMQLERDLAGIEGARARNLADIAKAKQSVSETQLLIGQEMSKYRDGIIQRLEEAERLAFDTYNQVNMVADTLKRTEVTAPVSGTVVGLSVHTEGAVISPGQVLLEIVPDRDTLVVEVQLQPQDIDSVTTGQQADVQLSSYSHQDLGKIPGSVIYVSADRMDDQRTGQSFFLAEVEVNQRHPALRGIKLTQGMPAEVFINTGRRSPLKYLLGPLDDALGRAWRES